MHIMLDLETMGNNNRAAIIAVGAVAFDINGVVDKFYQQVILESSVSAGMQIDTSTILWWLKQSDAARSAFDNNEQSESLLNGLAAFTVWFNKVDGCEVWGDGAAFDNTILSSAYGLLKIQKPWKFWNDRCYRTIKNLYPDVEMTRTGTHHNAVDDAESQALHLIEVCKRKGIEL